MSKKYYQNMSLMHKIVKYASHFQTKSPWLLTILMPELTKQDNITI